MFLPNAGLTRTVCIAVLLLFLFLFWDPKAVVKHQKRSHTCRRRNGQHRSFTERRKPSLCSQLRSPAKRKLTDFLNGLTRYQAISRMRFCVWSETRFYNCVTLQALLGLNFLWKISVVYTDHCVLIIALCFMFCIAPPCCAIICFIPITV